ncbi:MAG: VOC family protein [Chloroflexota bacterium]
MNLHTRLLVADFDRCFHFYNDVLGFTVRFGSQEQHYVHFAIPGGGEMGLYPRTMMADVVGTANLPEDAPSEDRFTLILDVDDVDSEVERLKGCGVALVTEVQDRPLWRERTAHMRDPDGNLIEIKSTLQQ